jgi:hypothetical protein
MEYEKRMDDYFSISNLCSTGRTGLAKQSDCLSDTADTQAFDRTWLWLLLAFAKYGYAGGVENYTPRKITL